ncbi:finTRIM family, member 86 [Tachysurus ichikawai]
MATFSCTPDEFSCPVCLEILSDPATIPCGHTYCLQCIQKHWDKASKANPLLLPAAERSDGTTGPDEKTTVQGGLYPQLPSTLPKLCPLHKQVLEFYCRDDKEIVCDECSLIEHKGHRVVNPDEEMEQELSKKKAKILGSIQERERIIQTLPQIFQAKKTAIQGLQTENLEVFGEVMKNVELMSSQVNELLKGYEASCYHRTENHGYKLREEINQLYKQDVELNRLSMSQDSIQFLKTLDTTECVDVVGNAQLEIVPPESVEPGIRSALGAFREGLHDLCKGSLANIFRAVNDAQTATAQNSQAAEKCPDPNNLQAASQNTALEMTSGSNNSDNKPKTTSLQHPAASSANSGRHNVAFAATLTPFTGCVGPYNKNVSMSYGNVTLNQGYGYNPALGTFTAPRAGLYSFSYTVYSNVGAEGERIYHKVQLMKDGQVIASSWEDNREDSEDSATQTVLLQMKQGNQVYMELVLGRFLCADTQGYNSFSGYLVYPMSDI